ncbi:hypothetical protein C4572_01725 [Candidatus Parcubacteria bacterium]|nr:MAG: hypothetical protein C4572_01725 [Candidatus Parcubacteria bacterium]
MSKFFAVVMLVVMVAFSSAVYAEEKAATTQVQGWDEFLATHEKVMADVAELVRVAKEASAFLSDFITAEKQRLLEEARKDAEESAKNAQEYEEARKELRQAFENYFKN